MTAVPGNCHRATPSTLGQLASVGARITLPAVAVDAWLVEVDGRVVATLADARFEDMFWMSYVVRPTAEIDVFAKAFWDRCDLVFRHRETGAVAGHAFPGGRSPSPEVPRIWMRALYLRRPPTWRDRVRSLLSWLLYRA